MKGALFRSKGDILVELREARERIAALEAELSGIMSTSIGEMLQESQAREARQVGTIIELRERIAELEGAKP